MAAAAESADYGVFAARAGSAGSGPEAGCFRPAPWSYARPGRPWVAPRRRRYHCDSQDRTARATERESGSPCPPAHAGAGGRVGSLVSAPTEIARPRDALTFTRIGKFAE